jgi:hypothetical protein
MSSAEEFPILFIAVPSFFWMFVLGRLLLQWGYTLDKGYLYAACAWFLSPFLAGFFIWIAN